MGFDFKEMSGLTEIMKDRNIWKALLAEFLGTLILVFVGCGSCTNWGDGTSIVQISLAFGITVATMAQVILLKNYFLQQHMWLSTSIFPKSSWKQFKASTKLPYHNPFTFMSYLCGRFPEWLFCFNGDHEYVYLGIILSTKSGSLVSKLFSHVN